jgi:gliding motility-associated-like protein
LKTYRLIFYLLIISNAITVFAQKPVADFSNNDSSGCDIVIVSFTDLSSNNPTSWKWNFGNGVNSTLPNPTCAYTNPGTYTVKLVVKNASGEDSITKTNLITVFKSPTVRYTASKLNSCPPFTIFLTDNTTPGSSGLVTWQWDFGDGSFSNSQNTSHTYNNTGTFFISLKVTDVNGCIGFSINTDSVKIHPAPVAGFTSNAQTSCFPPFTVNFTNTSTGNSSLTYLWSFGDGSTSNAVNPNHTYNNIGSYNVSLTVTDTSGCVNTLNIPGYINITGPLTYKANFSVSDTTSCSSSVIFTDLSSVGTNLWRWYFGDGGSSTQQNPTHAYVSSGTYTVTFIASNNLPCASQPSDTMIKTIHVIIFNKPVANFSVDDSIGCNAPFTVNFTDLSPSATTWNWDFGDGATSTDENPTHTYNSVGTHVATLTITDSNGCTAIKTKNIYMSVPSPSFIVSDTIGCAPLTVNFTNLSTSNYPITNYLWNFGDGGTSNLINPSHVYSDSGSFSVTLTVIDINGCQNSIIYKYIKTGIKPNANFFSNDTNVCHITIVGFNNTSSIYANYFHWKFGDSTESFDKNPGHQYQDTGYFSVTLITGFNGCYDTLVRHNYIHIWPPIARFMGVPRISCTAPLTVSFTDLSLGADTYTWFFGDGSPVSNLKNPTHTYTSPGFYNVKLIVSSLKSPFCLDSADYFQYIIISEIIPGFTQSGIYTCMHNTITFTDSSYANTAISKYAWDFGDGYRDTVFSPTIVHQFDSAGTFNITHTVFDILNCNNSITKNSFITVYKNPIASFTIDTTYGCVPLNVAFNPLPSIVYPPAVLTRWEWNFGDGSPLVIDSTGQVIHHIYTVPSYPGNYCISLRIIDSKGCENNYVNNNCITPTFPNISISYDSVTCYNDSFRVINNSTGAGLNYTWNFGDGTPVDNARNPAHLYTVTSTKNFSVTYIVSDANGCDTSIVFPITISKPIAHFYYDSIVSNCPPIFVNFHDSSTSDVVSWIWDFGDGNIISGISEPQHVFNKAGYYDVTLIVTNIYGCVDTFIMKNLLIKGPFGTISYNPTQGCAPLTVTFTSQTQKATTLTWIFGNGDVAFGGNVIYTYPDSGTFIPILHLHDTSGCDVNIIGTQPITVYPKPIANYTVNNGCINTPISFTDSSKTFPNNPLVSYDWNFDDGTSGSGLIMSHNYTIGGFHNPSLIVTTDKGCKDTASKTIEIYNPKAKFSFQNGCINTPISFIDSSYSTNHIINSWNWDFGDSTTATNKNPIHTYDSAATYIVSLSVTDNMSCPHDTSMTIKIFPQPVAQFSNPPICANNLTPFNDLSADTSGINSWSWNFGDGGTSNIQNPSHSYSNYGTYQLVMIVQSGNGCKDTVSRNIIVNSLPVPNLTVNNVCELINTNFINKSTIPNGNIVSWTWDFGDGQFQNNGDTVPHAYIHGNTYTPKIIAVSDSGCVDSIAKILTIYFNPKANFISDSICLYNTTTITDLSTSKGSEINKWSWDFGDTTTATTKNPQHKYNIPGNHSATLQVTTLQGCISDTTIDVYVKYLPLAQFVIPDTICAKQTISTNNSSVAPADGIINIWQWDFGNGTTSSSKDTTMRYVSPGNYNVSLIAIANTGCSDTAGKHIIVLPSPIAYFSAKPLITTMVFPQIEFKNLSDSYVKWLWKFGDGNTSIEKDPSHTYNDTGTYNIVLYAYNILNCLDSFSLKVTIKTEFAFYIPNAFSPNANGVNDVFNGKGVCISKFEFLVFNRWGEIIFKSTDKYKGWNGRTHNGEYAQIGVYAYVFNITDYNGVNYQYIGRVSLIK